MDVLCEHYNIMYILTKHFKFGNLFNKITIKGDYRYNYSIL